MSLIEKQAPDFKARAVFPLGEIKDFKLSDYLGRNIVLFFYPLNFTFVCPTELIAINKQIMEFEKLNTEVLGISVDSEFSHQEWISKDISNGGIGKLNFPLVSDISKEISSKYDVLDHISSVALRGTFIINTKGIVKYLSINTNSVGRNIDEIIRVIKAIAFHEQHGDVCPANWDSGKEAVVPTKEGILHYLVSNDI